MLREHYYRNIYSAFQVNPVVALLGPRQCGKTTLAREYVDGEQLGLSDNYFDLERPSALMRLQNPELSLSRLSGLIVIDEIQRMPELFPLLRALIDEPGLEQQYLILGSASRELIKQSSESLAGRMSHLELTPFTSRETGEVEQLWLRGGFPNSYLAETSDMSYRWRDDYIRTFLEQDIPNLGIQIPPTQLRRFWSMMAHYHGNVLNASELGRALSLSHNTIRNYIDILAHTYMLRVLQPWHANLKKRQVKSPKIYLRDSGLLHNLLGLPTQAALFSHPKVGASWEGFVIEELIRLYGVDAQSCYFWATHSEAELDLMIVKDNRRIGFEIKFTERPKLTRSMQIAENDLELDECHVIFPGNYSFPLTETITASGFETWVRER